MDFRHNIKNDFFSLSLFLVSLLLSLLLAEGIARLYVSHVAKRAKLFEPDQTVGWKVLPNINMKRLNANGKLWEIKTDSYGNRATSSWDEHAITKVLILGDSFAFGEGIPLENRFDVLIKARRSDWSLINLGVMGYGTDQQIIRARSYFPSLKTNDIIIILTHFSDFYDILRHGHSGRAKPWFELTENGRLVEHGPDISWRERLRDRSYVFSKLISVFEQQCKFTKQDIIHAGRLYRSIILTQTESLLQRRVRITIAYHGIREVHDDDAQRSIQASLDRTCSVRGIDCLALDRYLIGIDNANNFLLDGHWNSDGHKVIAEVLGDYLSKVVKGAP